MPTSDSSAARIITVSLAIAPDGSVSLQDEAVARLDRVNLNEAMPPAARAAQRDAPFDADYSRRGGYDAAFLGDAYPQVPLPQLQPALQQQAARLLGQPEDGSDCELKYHNFSVIMHAQRRLAILSAANISAGARFQISRPSDKWRLDPRIDSDAQLDNFYYQSNKFDRGHLTRREDLEFGDSPVAALQSAADTCHWTNCAPQHERFNQGTQLWQGLERFVLEEGIYENRLNIQVFTGPVLAQDDPVYARFPEIGYPLRFWKVVVAPMGDARLSATGYLLDQSDMVKQHGVEIAPPFGQYRTFQVPLDEIETLTQLRFDYQRADGKPGSLTEFDPLQGPRALPLQESPVARRVQLRTLEDIVL